jgi:hypothetical protein
MFLKYTNVLYEIKWKAKTNHQTVGIVPKPNRKIPERDKIGTANTYT